VITFDDGYQDFKTHAWPLLKRYGFSALVFLVTGDVGGSNRWDAVYGGEPISLLGWDDVRQLRDEGVEFGSHSVTHPYLTGLPNEDIIREAARSQMALEREIERPVLAFAYPYGDMDEIVQHWIGACGYTFGLSCRPGPATHDDSLLALPRIEIIGTGTVEDVKRKLGLSLRDAISRAVPADATLMVVSKGDQGLLDLGVRQSWHFPRTSSGAYAGHYPADSEAAIAHLEELRAQGGTHLLFPHTAMWWLDHYRGLQEHLARHYHEEVLGDDLGVLYSL
jgi:peptidoglycan/xylan/chitin deacetylase (PgdA/CDA1 family)